MMWSRRALVGALALAWVAGATVADEHSPLYDHMAEGVLDMHIEARVITGDMPADDQTVLWDASMTRQTMMGRSVTIRMQGSNVLVSVRLTPYLNADNVLMLICQGETWISREDGTGVSYRTSLEALSVDHGEPVYFFPLGAGARAEVIAAERSRHSVAQGDDPSDGDESSSGGASIDPENDYNLVLEILVMPSSTEDSDSTAE